MKNYQIKLLPTPDIPRDKVVYLHRRESDGLPFYVGIGANDRPYVIEKRNQDWTTVYNEHGRTVELLMSGLIEWHAKSIEVFLIFDYRRVYGKFREDGYITNLSDGGEGCSGYKFTDDQRYKVSSGLKSKWKNEDYRNNQFTAQNNPEVKARHSNSVKKALNNPEVKARHSNSMKLVWTRPEVKERFIGENNPSKRPEVKAKISSTLTGKFVAQDSANFRGYAVGINENSFIILAGLKEMKDHKFDQGGISSCISGNRKSHKGFKWVRMTTINPDDFIGLEPYNELSAERLKGSTPQ